MSLYIWDILIQINIYIGKNKSLYDETIKCSISIFELNYWKKQVFYLYLYFFIMQLE